MSSNSDFCRETCSENANSHLKNNGNMENTQMFSKVQSCEEKKGCKDTHSSSTNTPFPTHPASQMTEKELELEEAHFLRVLEAFSLHGVHCERILQKYRSDYENLPEAHQLLLFTFKEKIEQANACIKSNQIFYNIVIAPHMALLDNTPPKSKTFDNVYDEENDGEDDRRNGHYEKLAGHSQSRMVKINPNNQLNSIALTQTESENLRSLLRQVMRDWSDEGREERESSYGFILKTLIEAYPVDRQKISVLVPGAGLGRLAYEISQLGFNCQGNEFSLFMLLTSELFLTRNIPIGALQVYPFVFPFSNTMRTLEQFRAVPVPDVTVKGAPADFSMVAGDFLQVYAGQKECFDVIATSYFIDTAQNIVEYIQLIHDLLVGGGLWINTGPLLYHFEGHAKEPSIELCMEEIQSLCKSLGFTLEFEEFTDSTYAQNKFSLHQTIYRCWSFRARKSQ